LPSGAHRAARPPAPALAEERGRRRSRAFARKAPAPHGRGASTRAHRHFARGRRGALDGAPARFRLCVSVNPRGRLPMLPVVATIVAASAAAATALVTTLRRWGR